MKRHSYSPSEGHRLRHDPFSAIVGPRPIGWISSLSVTGVRNLAPYSFFNAFNYRPPIVGFASVGWKDSVHNLRETGEFGWNLATAAMADAMNESSASVHADVDEFVLTGLTAMSADLIAAPLVAECPVTFECRVSQSFQLKNAVGDNINTWLTLGEVIKVHIDDSLIEDGVYCTTAARPILRGGGASDYFMVEEAAKFLMPRPPTPKT